MTIEQALQIKKFLEGNFLKVKELDDNLFTGILSEYNYELMAEAVRKYIKTNKYTPNIATLLEEYEKVKLYKKTEIIRQMNKAGYFKDISEYEKSIKFIKEDIIPYWFRDMMVDFINQQKIDADKRLMLEMIS